MFENYQSSVDDGERRMRLRHAMVCSSNNNRSMEAHLLLKRQGLDVSSYGTGSQVKLPGPSIREPNVYDFGTPYRQMHDDLRRKDPDLYHYIHGTMGVAPSPRGIRVQEKILRFYCFPRRYVSTLLGSLPPPNQRVKDVRLHSPRVPQLAICYLLHSHRYTRNGILPMLWRNSTIKHAPQRWQDNAMDGSFDVVFSFEERVFDMIVEDLQNREHKLMKTVLIINMDVKDNHEEAAIGAKLALELCQEIENVEYWEDAIDDIVAAFEKQHKRKLLYSISFY